jgi:hypothetical protein
MSDRDVEAQPGDNYQPEIEDETQTRPSGFKPLEMPRKADVSRSQAHPLPSERAAKSGLVGASTPAVRAADERAPEHTPAVDQPRGQVHETGARYCPDCGSERAPSDLTCIDCGAVFETVHAPERVARSYASTAVAAPAANPSSAAPDATVLPRELSARVRRRARPEPTKSRLSAAHPIARLRIEDRRHGLGRSLRAAAPVGRHALSIGASQARRQGRRLLTPSLRNLVTYAGLTATFAVVVALVMTLPSHPPVNLSSGSVYGVNWSSAVKPPFDKVDFGPYFVTVDTDLLMVNTTGQSTTVWVTKDGSSWSQKSGSGAFGMDGRRFVVQGFSDDGQGGLVVVGNSVGSKPTDVIATAWRSQDGVSWARMDVQGGGSQEMIGGVAARPGAIVAAGNGVAWFSADGRSWSAQALPGASAQGGTYTPRAVGAWNGGFVIIGLWKGTGATRSTAWYSATGQDWKQAKTSLDGFDVRGIAGLNGKIVAGGIDLGSSAPGLAASWTSTDGATWTKATAPSDIASIAMDGVIKVGESVVAYGAPATDTTANASQPPISEAVWVTDDGLTWLPLPSSATPLSLARIGSVGNSLILVGNASAGARVISGTVAMGTSRAAASQTAAPGNYVLQLQAGNSSMINDITKDFTLGSVISVQDRFYVFATGPTGTSIFTSTGLSELWPQEESPIGLTSLVVSAKPGTEASAQPSASPQPSASAQPSGSAAPAQAVVTGRPVVLEAVPDGSGGILAIGKITNTSGDNGMIWHMTKAGEWRQVSFQDAAPPEFASIAVASNGFVATADVAGGSQVMYSNDGETWQAATIAVGDGFALTVATYKNGFVAVGTDPARDGATTAWTSSDGQTWTMRTDWKLPPNVTALFGMGNNLIATADTAITAPTASASAAASAKAPAKATPTPAAPVQTTTWWWSTTGVGWQQSGLQISGSNWAIVNGQLLALDAPIKATDAWTAWSSADGKSWQRPATSAQLLFPGAKTCAIGSSNNQVVIVGWASSTALKDYKGQFASE